MKVKKGGNRGRAIPRRVYLNLGNDGKRKKRLFLLWLCSLLILLLAYLHALVSIGALGGSLILYYLLRKNKTTFLDLIHTQKIKLGLLFLVVLASVTAIIITNYAYFLRIASLLILLALFCVFTRERFLARKISSPVSQKKKKPISYLPQKKINWDSLLNIKLKGKVQSSWIVQELIRIKEGLRNVKSLLQARFSRAATNADKGASQVKPKSSPAPAVRSKEPSRAETKKVERKWLSRLQEKFGLIKNWMSHGLAKKVDIPITYHKFIPTITKKPLPEHKEDDKGKKEEKPVREITIKLGPYETELDALYSLVTQRGSISLKEVVETFHIEAKIVEEWIKILESHQLVTITYSPFGAPILSTYKPTKGEGEEP